MDRVADRNRNFRRAPYHMQVAGRNLDDSRRLLLSESGIRCDQAQSEDNDKSE